MRLAIIPFAGLIALTGLHATAADAPVSFYKDVRPILVSNCNACHKPDKMKAELDMTTYAALMKGGKHGKTVVPGKPAESSLIEEITGPDPSMPKDADPLKAQQVTTIERWIKEGAKDDTPAPGTAKVEPPVYSVPPGITSIAYSPDGSVLAVAGYHEVLLQKPDGSGLIGRLVGEAPRVESIAFSKDGKMLAVAGGAPAEFGQVQIWDVAKKTAIKTYQPSTDSLYGVSFAPDGKSVACGAADKTVRRIDVDSGKILTEFKAHADWVLSTTFTLDGKTIVTGGRDKAMKLVDVETGRFVDDINNPLEQVLCMSRNPKQEQILYGGDLGIARIYKISDNQNRTNGRNDTNLLATFERQAGPISSVAWNPEGTEIAIGSIGEVRLYDAKNPVANAMKVDPKTAPREINARIVLSGMTGPVFSVAWKPDGSEIATAGADGTIRLFDAKTGELKKQFVPFPIEKKPSTQPAATAR